MFDKLASDERHFECKSWTMMRGILFVFFLVCIPNAWLAIIREGVVEGNGEIPAETPISLKASEDNIRHDRSDAREEQSPPDQIQETQQQHPLPVPIDPLDAPSAALDNSLQQQKRSEAEIDPVKEEQGGSANAEMKTEDKRHHTFNRILFPAKASSEEEEDDEDVDETTTTPIPSLASFLLPPPPALFHPLFPLQQFSTERPSDLPTIYNVPPHEDQAIPSDVSPFGFHPPLRIPVLHLLPSISQKNPQQLRKIKIVRVLRPVEDSLNDSVKSSFLMTPQTPFQKILSIMPDAKKAQSDRPILGSIHFRVRPSDAQQDSVSPFSILGPNEYSEPKDSRESLNRLFNHYFSEPTTSTTSSPFLKFNDDLPFEEGSGDPQCFTFKEAYQGTKSVINDIHDSGSAVSSAVAIGKGLKKAVEGVGNCAQAMLKGMTHFLGFKKRSVEEGAFSVDSVAETNANDENLVYNVATQPIEEPLENSAISSLRSTKTDVDSTR